MDAKYSDTLKPSRHRKSPPLLYSPADGSFGSPIAVSIEAAIPRFGLSMLRNQTERPLPQASDFKSRSTQQNTRRQHRKLKIARLSRLQRNVIVRPNIELTLIYKKTR